MSTSTRADVALIGGGIVGACLAEELARAGASVLVLDAGPEPGQATRAAAGVAVASLRYLAEPDFFAWLCGARETLATDIARLEPAYGRFSLAAPIVRLLGHADLDAYPDAARLAGDVVELPRLAPQEDGRRAYRAPGGLMVDGPGYLAAAYKAALDAGVTWLQDAPVGAVTEDAAGVSVVLEDGGTLTADRAVVTAGAWSGRLTGVPVGPQRGQLAVLEPAEPLPFIVSDRHYLAPRPGGGVVAGATEEDAGFADRPTAAGIARVLARAVRAVPDLADAAVVEVRAGLRPVSATGRPVCGRVPDRKRVYVAAGHAGHGLLSARHTARGMAAGLVDRDWDRLPEEFCPVRRDA